MSYNPNIDYAAEIEKEMKKDKVDWGAVSRLSQERNEKIKATGMQTQSTSDYIDKLWAERNQTNAPTLPAGQKAVAMDVPDNIRQMARDNYNKGLTSTYQPNERGIYTDASGNVMGVLGGQDQSYYDNLMKNALPGDELSMVRALSSTATTADVFDLQQYIEELKAAQIRQQIAALDKAKSNALSALADEEAGLKPYYYDLRNRTAAQSDISAKNFAEYMAAQGIRGSAAGLPEIYRQSALQGQLGTLNRQEAADIADIARRRSGIESAYESDVAAAMADIDAQTLQNYIDNMRIMQAQRAADLAAQGKTSTGELTLQGRQAQQNELAQQAALLAARYYDDIQTYINTLDPNDPLVPYLYAERQKKIQAEAEKAAAAAAAASEEEQRAWKRAFDLFQSTGRITSAEQARILGLPMGATVADVDIARMNAATSRMNAQTSAYNAQQRTQQQAAQAASQRIQQYADIIDRLYVNTQYDNDGRAIGKTFDPNAVKAYIQNLNQTGQISDDEARQLLGMYGFTF